MISQSFHRGTEPGGAGLSSDDVYKDWLALHWPYPTIVQAAATSGRPTPTTSTRRAEFVNHKGYNTLSVGNHNDTAGAMSADSVFRNPSSTHGDRELPEISANGTGVTRRRADEQSGTSFAAPAAAGVAALLQRRRRDAAVVARGLPRDPAGRRHAATSSSSTWWADVVARRRRRRRRGRGRRAEAASAIAQSAPVAQRRRRAARLGRRHARARPTSTANGIVDVPLPRHGPAIAVLGSRRQGGARLGQQGRRVTSSGSRSVSTPDGRPRPRRAGLERHQVGVLGVVGQQLRDRRVRAARTGRPTTSSCAAGQARTTSGTASRGTSRASRSDGRSA